MDSLLLPLITGSSGTRERVSTLRDNFSTLDTANNWNAFAPNGEAISIVGGELSTQILSGSTNTQAFVFSKKVYDLTDNAVVYKLTQMPRTSGDAAGAEGRSYLDLNGAGNQIGFWAQSWGSIDIDVRSNYSTIGGGWPVNIAWPLAEAVWLRMRERGGVVYFDTAPQTASNPPLEAEWTQRASIARTALPGAPSRVTGSLALGAGCWGSVTVTASPRYDALNTVAGAGNAVFSTANSAGYQATPSALATSKKNVSTIASPPTYAYTPANATSVGSGGTPIATLTDNFDAGAIDTGKWTVANSANHSQSQSGGTLNQLPSGLNQGQASVNSAKTFSLNGSSAFVRFIPPVGVDSIGYGYECNFEVLASEFDGIGMYWASTAVVPVLTVRLYTTQSGTVVSTEYPYSPTTNAWWRIKIEAGTIYWQTAPATASNPPIEGDWVNLHTIAASTFTASLNTLGVQLRSGSWTAMTTSPSAPAKWDGLNTAASALAVATNSTASPATYSFTGAPAGDLIAVASVASPATYAFTGAPAGDLIAAASFASPAAYSFAATSANDLVSGLTVGSPSAYAWTAAAATSFVGVASINTPSVASPATYAASPAPATSRVFGLSNANPASYASTAVAATARLAYGSVASPAGYASTGSGTADITVGGYPSTALPASYGATAAATADILQQATNANQHTYTATAASASGLLGTRGTATPPAYSATGANANAIIGRNSAALAAVYAATAVQATAGRGFVSIANPANYASVGAATTTRLGHEYVSAANAGAYSAVINPTKDTTTGIEDIPPAPPPPLPSPIETISNQAFNNWLRDEAARRIILLETQCIDANGNSVPLYFATLGYVSRINDSLQNRYYTPLIRGGLDFQQKINLDLGSDMSYGDIELDNTEGDLDWLFGMQFQYQPVKAYIGDATWPRAAFRQIFEGIVEDIDSSARDTVNVKLREKLWRLDMPLHDFKVGGTVGDPDALMPVTFGECHNVTPVLLDGPKLRYSYHLGASEAIIEVRDNGIPIQVSSAVKNSPSYFELLQQPFGRVTCSVQGDYTSVNGYQNLPSDIIFTMLTGWGTEPTKRFVAEDVDLDNFFQFKQDNINAPIGIYITERMTVLEAAQMVAAAVGARLTQSLAGKIRLVRLEVPPPGTPIQVTQSDMLNGTLQIVNRLPLVPSVKIGYARNWTIQEDTAAGVPEEHRKLYAREYLSITGVNQPVRDLYRLPSEPMQDDTLLLTRSSAIDEMQRRLRLRTYQRHIYEFTGFADLMMTEVGAPIRIEHPRFNISGKTGQVVSVAVDWIHSRTTLQVLV